MPPESLRCKECQTPYPLDARYVCEQLLRPARGRLRARVPSADPDALRRRIQAGPHSIWRYGDFLPVAGPAAGARCPPAGRRCCAPTGSPRRSASSEVWIKNDAANPTHSFKDRVVSVALARARELGFTTIACASTGNLANAVAAHAAAAGLESYVFIPSDLEEQKILATGVYGTNLVAVRGNYDDVNRLCTELSGEHDWAFVNINMRPYYAEGSKTLAFETAEQLGFELPDRVVAPIASGSLFTKIARGFRGVDRARAGRGRAADVQRRPGRRAARRWRARSPAGQDFCRPVKPDTIAKSLAIGNPADGPYALDLARAGRAAIDSVTDDEIREGIRLLARTTGIFTETAGGVTTAVLAKLAERGDIDPLRAGRRLHHRRGPEDARLRARHVRGLGDRARRSASFEAARERVVVPA